MACEILVSQSRIKPVPPALEAHSLNHWTTREVPLTASNSLWKSPVVPRWTLGVEHMIGLIQAGSPFSDHSFGLRMGHRTYMDLKRWLLGFSWECWNSFFFFCYNREVSWKDFSALGFHERQNEEMGVTVSSWIKPWLKTTLSLAFSIIIILITIYTLYVYNIYILRLFSIFSNWKIHRCS